ncbi:ski oncogene isoform X2 [Cloeon dipterum]|uniref:ski oncogene isoform X2 n=1 Tax=Cloeon dipterum TaxID=197152 RepID=UPI00321F82C2
MMEAVVSNGLDSQQQKRMYSPHLKKVLKTYQLTAQRSLKGPAGVDSKVEVKAGGSSPPPPPTQQPPPVFYTQDRPNSSELLETVLRGASISCFNVGGELRLCLPQVINSVLHGFQPNIIYVHCDELMIHCSRCSPEQLDVLKRDKKLPDTAVSCGLITQTDAERLSGALLNTQAMPCKVAASAADSVIRVYHECFGVCHGLLTPALFDHDESECVECCDCRRLFSPQHFVTHVHVDLENRTCHWGFDSAKWRAYLLLDEDQPDAKRLKDVLVQLKQRPVIKYKPPKRKQYEDQIKIEAPPLAMVNGKRQRLHYDGYMLPMDPQHIFPSGPPPYSFHDPINFWVHNDMVARMAAPFRHWPIVAAASKEAFKMHRDPMPFSLLSHAAPILTNPSRVVPFSESDRFESQPNVALAPLSQSLQRSSTQVKSASLGKEPKPIEKIVQRPSSTTAPVHSYNPEIELSTDTEDSDSAPGTSGVVIVTAVDEETKLLSSLARCVADADGDARRLGEHALQVLREVTAGLRNENQMLKSKLDEIECRMSEERAQHEKEIAAMSLERLRSPQHVIQHPHNLQNGSAQRTSPATSVITSSSAIVKKEPLNVD